MFLATTALSEFWDPSDELVLLGPWCARWENRAEWRALSYRWAPNPWEDRQAFAQACDYCDGAAERLLARLAEFLNAEHGTSFSSRYWRIVLGLWLPYHVQQLYDHYVHLRMALSARPDLTSVVLDPEDWRTPADFPEFLRWAQTDAYHLQLYSLLLGALRSGLPSRRLPAPPPEAAAGEGPARAAAGAACRLLRGIGAGKVLAAEMYLTPWQALGLTLRSVLRILPLCAPASPGARAEASSPRRARLAELGEPGEFGRLLGESLARHLPALYLEGFAAAREDALRRLGRTPRVVASSVGWSHHEALKLAAAEAAEKGSRLVAIQHGGGYGMVLRHPQETHERRLADRFYGWGWADLEGDPRLGELPHPKAARLLPAAADARDILLVATAEPLLPLRLARGPVGLLGLEYMEWQARFVQALPEALRGRLLVRAYPADYGWGQEGRLAERFPGLRFAGRDASLEAGVRGARLVVVDHPGTTFLETLPAGVPSLSFWDPRYWELRPSAGPFIDKLKGAGLHHESPESAAAQAAAVYEGALGWWDSPGTLAARESFARRFALRDHDWMSAWSRALLSEAGVQR